MISGDRAAEEPFPLFAHTATHSTVDEIEIEKKNDEIDDDHVFWAIKKIDLFIYVLILLNNI